MSRWKAGAIVVVAVAVAGCAGAPAPGTGPAVAGPAPAQWQRSLPASPEPAPSTGAAGTTSTAAGDPWSAWGDPLLEQLVAAARQASPTLASASARIERARAGLAAASARLWPTLDAQGAATRGRSEPAGVAVTSLSLGLQAGWEIDLLGGVQAGRVAADARLRGAQAAADAARLALAADTAAALVALRSCNAQLELVRADSESRNETARLTALRTRAGFGSPADEALASASAAQGRSQWLAQGARCEALLLGLSELTAIDEVALRRLLGAASVQRLRPPPLSLELLPADLLRRRPDLYETEQAVLTAAAGIDEARAAQGPQLRLAGNIGAARIDIAGVRQSGSTWSFGPVQLMLPVFDGGTRRAQARAAEAAFDEAASLYRAQLRRAVREVEQALLQLRSSTERGQDARRAADGFDASLRAAEARQRVGLASLFELEDARRSAFAARSALIDLDREQALAWIDLHRALGGGWRAPEPLVSTR